MTLLRSVPRIWAAVPPLSSADELAHGLLVSCGLVERKAHLRLRMAGGQQAVDLTFTFSGSEGLAKAVEPGLAEAWALWGLKREPHQRVYVESLADLNEWRLTDQGQLALADLDRGDERYLYDFLRTPPDSRAGTLPAPRRFVPGHHRPVVPGDGHVLGVKLIDTITPVSVRVENMAEVSGPLANIAAAIEKWQQAPQAPETGPESDRKEQQGSGVKWQEVRKNMLDALENNAKPMSMKEWAKRFGCSPSTVCKVVKRVPKLRDLVTERTRSPRAQSLGEKVLDEAIAPMPDPADDAAQNEQQRLDAALVRLLAKAKPEERTKLSNMPKAKLNEICRQLIEQEKDSRRRRILDRKA